MNIQQDSQADKKGRKCRGEVVYIYAFDMAYDMKDTPTGTLLSQQIRDYSAGQSKRSPKNAFFYRPQMIVLPPETREGPHGAVEVRRSVKLFSVGAISIQIRVPFEVENLKSLVAYHEIRFETGSHEKEAYNIAEKVLRELKAHYIRPVSSLTQDEAYTVFCLYELPQTDDGRTLCAEDWLMSNRREVAGLLMEEHDAAKLSEQESTESTELYVSYYDDDLVVVDWDAALVIGKEDNLDDIIHIMELANVQMVELETYDRVLDESLELAYRDVARGKIAASQQMHRKLREIRVDLARLSDELSNITKFFGDWYLARIFENLAVRFHLGDLHGVIDEKLKTLGELYQLIQQDRFNFWMMILEVTIVLLFVIDLALLIWR